MEKGAGMYLINLKKEIISEDMPLTEIQNMFKGLQDEELRNLVICLDKNHAEQFIRERIVVRGGKNSAVNRLDFIDTVYMQCHLLSCNG